MSFCVAAAVGASLLAILVLWHRGTFGAGLPLPPGPRALPFIGCVHLLPTEAAERKFREWGQKYGTQTSFAEVFLGDDKLTQRNLPGPVISVPLFSRSVVVVNTLDAARDLMEKRSSNYSDRPDAILLEE